MTGQACEAFFIFLGIELGMCGQSPAAMYQRACMHEHVRVGPVCPEHADQVGAGLCLECLEHPSDPHECGINLVPLEATS